MRKLTKPLAVAGTLVLASCGGSDDDKSDKTTATTAKAEVTRASYIAAADALCKKSNAIAKGLNQRAQAAVQSQSTDQARLKALVPILREGYKIQQRRVEELTAIPGPPADQASIDRLRGGFQRRTTLLGELVAVAEAQDVKGYTRVAAQQNRLQKKVLKLARTYGLKECASRNNEAD